MNKIDQILNELKERMEALMEAVEDRHVESLYGVLTLVKELELGMKKER